jgi:hypothetical protein
MSPTPSTTSEIVNEVVIIDPSVKVNFTLKKSIGRPRLGGDATGDCPMRVMAARQRFAAGLRRRAPPPPPRESNILQIDDERTNEEIAAAAALSAI